MTKSTTRSLEAKRRRHFVSAQIKHMSERERRWLRWFHKGHPRLSKATLVCIVLTSRGEGRRRYPLPGEVRWRSMKV